MAPELRGIFLAVTFAGRADGPTWELWAARAVVALFWWSVGWLWAAACFRELRRCGKWIPPGATRRPRLAAAGYVAVMLLLATAVVVGIVVIVTGTN